MFKEKLLKHWFNGGCGGPHYYRWAGPDRTLFPCVPIVVSLSVAKIDLWSDGLENPGAPLAVAWSIPMTLDTEDDLPEVVVAGIVYLADMDKFFYGTFVPTSKTVTVRFKACGEFDANPEIICPRHNAGLSGGFICSK